MARRNITTGIDIGTYYVKVVVTEKVRSQNRYFPRIIGTGLSTARGMRHGYITDRADIQKSIREALQHAERSSGVAISRAYLSVGGVGLSATTATGKTAVSKADMEVTDADIKAATDASENEIPSSLSLNRKVVHAIPLEFSLDRQEVLGSPLGLKGSSLEATTLFITALESHITELMEAVEGVGVEVVDMIAAPFAASFVCLSKPQKIAGCVLANVGAETLSIVVFENNIPVSLEVFPVGGSTITNDIALNFKISLEEAEQVKRGAVTGSTVSQKRLNDILSARLSDMNGYIATHLKRIGRHELLPAGVVITGGCSGLSGIEEQAKADLNLPSSLASLGPLGKRDTLAKDQRWSVAYGLCIIGLNEEGEGGLGIGSFLQRTRSGVLSWFRQFLP